MRRERAGFNATAGVQNAEFCPGQGAETRLSACNRGVPRCRFMDEGTKKLGSLLQVARQARRPKLTQPAAAAAIGVSRGTIQKIEAGDFAEVNKNVRKYATYLGFSDGEADRVARGEHEVTGGRSTASDHLPLPAAVEYELRASETLEAGVIPLGPDEDDGHIIVILQGRKGASPEELQRIAARYRKPRRMLQGLATEPDEVAES